MIDLLPVDVSIFGLIGCALTIALGGFSILGMESWRALTPTTIAIAIRITIATTDNDNDIDDDINNDT